MAALGALWLCSRAAQAQVSPDQHAQHHPGVAGRPGMATNAPGMSGMEGMMQEMMRGMGAPPPKELYPALMSLPDLPPEKRTLVQQQAAERMSAGVGSMSRGFDTLHQAALTNNFAAMEDALAIVRKGLAQFDSGLAAQRALADGKAPRDVALRWFKHEMNLLPPVEEQHGFRLWGMTPFHIAIMASLILFAAAMIGMYFFKMRRAASLLQSLTGGVTAAPVRAPPPTITAPAPTQLTSTPAVVSQPKKWSGKLRVAQIFQETASVKTFRLMNPIGGALPFSYLPGQFLTLTVLLDGKPVKRSYTIASSPTQQDFVEVTVKHEEPGAVSDFLHNRVQAGDLLELSGPSGSFIFTGRECKCILLIGGGVGITPLMSVIRYLTDRSWPGDIYLLYSVNRPEEFIFREELEYLQRRHANLRMVVTVSHPEGTDWKGPTGRITKELISQFVPDLVSRYVHLCGPVPMMEAVRRMLAELGVPPDRIKAEAFGPVLGKPEPIIAPAGAPPSTAEETAARAALPTVAFSLSEKSAPLPSDKTVLEVADEIDVEIDNSCRVGTCGTCRVKLLAGKVTMEIEDGLEPGDKGRGIILACQAKSTGDVVVEA